MQSQHDEDAATLWKALRVYSIVIKGFSAAMLLMAVLDPFSVAGSTQSRLPEPPAGIFRSRADMVALDVLVEGAQGGSIPALGADDFLVLEDNVPQTVMFFSSAGRLPRAVVLLVDQSQSMSGIKLERAKAAASALLKTMDPGDLVEILAFNGLPARLYPMGSDHDAAGRALDGVSAGGTTRLYDALLIALRDLELASRDRPTDYQTAVVILSDGEDEESRQTYEDVLEDARRSVASIDAVSLRTDGRHGWLPPVHELAKLAFDTGGRAVAVRHLDDLISIYEGIGSDLRRRYRLAYVPSATARDGRWRRISVRVSNKDLVARTRAGYYAPGFIDSDPAPSRLR